MKQSKLQLLFTACLLIFAFLSTSAQNVLKGVVKDDRGEEIIGANILIKGTSTGTTSDFDGSFELKTEKYPVTLVVSYLGMDSQEIVVNDGAPLDIKMSESSTVLDIVTVGASRVEEKILEAPVTVEKLDLIAVRQSSSSDYYDEIAKLKGVYTNQASMTFTNINARGFASGGNTRFVQLMDGMDNAAPLLNFPSGNIVGIGELDINNVELVPGAASALYGPNAFNGILLMNSKNPFNYQGLSAQVKLGVTTSEAGGSHPMYNAGIRYAKAFNDKFAFKINVSGLWATDWSANDYVTDRLTESMDKNPVNFDGMNTYGDEFTIPLAADLAITRTGWQEGDLLDDNNAESFKGDIALHYKIRKDLELLYNYRIGQGSSIYQGSERYALRGFVQQFHKIELQGKDFFLRAYTSGTDDGDSYNMTALGSFTNEALFPTAIYEQGNLVGGWALAYGTALQGLFESLGVPGGDHEAARAFADAGGWLDGPNDNLRGTPRPASGSPELAAIVEQIRTGLFQKGGAGFIDDSKLYHVEGNYNLSKFTGKYVTMQVGANYRGYNLFSDGTIFNEDPEETGTNSRIQINEYGAYTQVGVKLLEEKLKVTGSIRYDKNENFKGRVTPRISSVLTLGEKRNHNIRASYQTGFRNPTTQAQFIYFPTTTILMGGTPANAERYGIYEGGAWTEASFQAFSATGDSSLLVTDYFDYVKPEQLQAFEIGYKAMPSSKFLIDVHAYYNIYNNFITQKNVVNKVPTTHKGVPVGLSGNGIATFRPYLNVDRQITSVGAAIGLSYKLPKNWEVQGNYAYADFELEEGDTYFEAGFNTPKHRINLGVANRKLFDVLGVSAAYRWQNEFLWESAFGSGMVEAFGAVDAQISYSVPKIKTVFKIGGTNIGGKDYRNIYGGPFVGQTYYISVTFDQFMQ